MKRWYAESFTPKRKVGKAFVWNPKEKYTAMIIAWLRNKNMDSFSSKKTMYPDSLNNFKKVVKDQERLLQYMTNRNNVICLLIVVLGLVIVEDEKEPHRKNKQAE